MFLRSLAGALCLLCVMATILAQAPKPPMPPGPITNDMIKPGQYTGKLLSLPDKDGAFTTEIKSQVPEAKPNTQALLQSAAKFELDYKNGIATIQRESGRDPAAFQKRMAEHLNWYKQNLPAYQPGGANYPYQLKDVVQPVDFTAAPDFKVRVDKLPAEFTDKGLPKKYTPAELRKLKGKDTRLPGYEAQKDDLTTGTQVQITVTKAKPPSKKEVTAKDVLHGPKNVVTVIMIVSKDGTVPKK